MIKFIELTSIFNRPMDINVDEIQCITEQDEGQTCIFLKGDDEPYIAKETVSEILAKIHELSNDIKK